MYLVQGHLIGSRLAIDFIVISLDLQLFVLDTQVKRGEMGNPNKSCGWTGTFSRESCQSSLTPTLSGAIPLSQGILEKWSQGGFKASMAETAALNCGWKVVVDACQGSNPRTHQWTWKMREAVKQKKEAFWDWLAFGSLKSADRFQQARRTAEAKNQVWAELWEAIFFADLKEVLANHLLAYTGEA